MKIKQYAGGGIVYTPFVSNRGIPQNYVETPSTPTSKKNEDSDWLNKEYVKMIQHNGLISDVNQTMDKMKHWHTYAKNMSNSYLMGGDNQYDLLSQMFDIQKEINANKRMQDSWTQAQTNAYNQGALGEVATTAGGNIYVWTKEGVTSVTPEEYSKNRGTGVYMDYNEDGSDYLTNNELLDIRERYVPGNTNLISNVSSTKGLSTITKEIRDIVKEFGHESITEYIKRTGNKITQSAWDGMQILIGEGPNGYYKVTTKTERRHVNDAVNYLLESIGAQSRNKLRATVAARGGNPNDDKEVYGIVLDALTIHTDYSQDPNFEKTATEYDPDGDGKGKSKLQLEDDPYLSVIAKGKGIKKYYSLIPGETNPSSDQVSYSVVGIPHGPLVDRNGNIIEQTSLPDALRRGEVFRGRPDTNVTFGNRILTENEIKKIVIDEQPMVDVLWLPYRETLNGVVPDFSMVDTYKEVNAYLKDNPDITSLQRNEYIRSKGIDPSKLSINQNGEWYVKTKLFTRIAGYISDDLIDINDYNKRFMDPVSKSDAKEKLKLFNTILKYGIQNPKKDSPKVQDTWDWFGGGDWDREDMFRGYIYTTAPDEWISALLTNQNKIDKQILSQIDARISLMNSMQFAEENSTWDTNF